MDDHTRPLQPEDDPERTRRAADPPPREDDEPTRHMRDPSVAQPGPGDGPDDGGWRSFGGRDLPVAIASGVLLAALLLGSLAWHPAAFTTLVVIIVLIGVIEAGRVLRENGILVAVPVVAVAALVLMVGAYRAGPAGQAVGLVVLLVGAVVWELVESDRQNVVREIAGTSFLGLWVPFLASFAVLLVLQPTDGWLAVVAAVGVAIVSDIGAFAVGTRYGRRKLAPSVSPGKTWEGVGGGILVASIVAVVLLPWLGTGELFTPLSAIGFAVAVSIAGVVGDLAESMVKRDIGVKDLGGVLPGHGGVLDRMDSVLLALPTAYYVLALLH
jgi:phosphatidate cytidylyltransferase